MKGLFRLAVIVAFLFSATQAFAQDGDKIVGLYRAVQDGNVSNVQVSKLANGAYKAQVVWVEKMTDENGKPKTDHKNPDPALRSTPADRIVLFNEVRYSGNGTWEGGKIYDPTRGKSFNVKVTFQDEKTLRVKGSLGPFSQSVYWTRIEK